MFVRLLIQEVKHVFDGEWQSAASVCCAEDGLKQVIHELLECTLSRRSNTGRVSLQSPLDGASGFNKLEVSLCQQVQLLLIQRLWIFSNVNIPFNYT